MRVHISLNVQSVAESAAFYEALFGAPASKHRDDYVNFRLDTPAIHLALQQGTSHAGLGASHFGIELPDQESLAAWRARLDGAGVAFAPEDAAQCCYATADKLWLTDPDGYRWEVWVRTGEHDEMGSTRVAPEATPASCCAA